MSTIYNPLTNDAFLTEFEGSGGSSSPTSNFVAAEGEAPSLLNTSSSPSTSLPSALDIPGTGSLFQNLPGLGGSGSTAASTGFLNLFHFPVSRAVAIILGLLLIAGGIIMFRPVNEVVGSAAKDAVFA